ncbi:MAG: GMC family oxidoreductase [Gammaproteobacteria bacterium]
MTMLESGLIYDYIIVGAGSAGCVLANRLSADPSCRVLLLEAGGEGDTPAVHTPAYYAQLQDSVYDWGYRTVPQNQMYGRRIFLPQGRVLGGSSAINYMIYMRGNREDYDHWQRLGSPGWSYEAVLPYFIRAENNQTFSDRYHGNRGPLVVTSHPAGNPLVERYFSAAQQVGIPFNPDFNGADQEGVGPMQATISHGRRCSTAAAYLNPVMSRPNLTVLSHALATRLLIKRRRAFGVEYIRLGTAEKAHAAGEVIVAAGALRSPHLLMLSGIGAKNELEAFDIKVQEDLPGVGKNLQDHLHTRVRCEIAEGFAFAPFVEEQHQRALETYASRHGGPLASNFLEAGAFVKSRPDEAFPGLQLFFLMTLPPDYPEAGATQRHGITLTAYINRPESRGEVRLASSDPLDRPHIDFNYLSAEDDLRCAIAGVRWNLKILYAQAFDDIRLHEVAPGTALRSDADLENFVRRTASTTWHPSGTCKMGSDGLAVVDARLRVHGIENLRVVDASIMPTIVSGNTNAPVIMIAEKATDMIMQG